MIRRVLAVAAGLALLGAAQGHANLLDYVLGRGPAPAPARTDSRFPGPAAAPPWDASLQAGSVDAGRILYVQGQQGDGWSRMLPCQSCHGADGVPQVGAPFPRLAGVTADYIAKQLDDYKAGRRKNAVMQQVAERLTAADMGSAALYLASLSPARWENAAAPGNEAGRRLQEQGDNARAIPACGACHGPQGHGTDQMLPPLAGLSAPYLREQMRNWRSAARANDAEALMRGIAAHLTDEEIASLADYYASMR